MPPQSPPVAPGCPWHALAAYGPANIKWCEARHCGWINEPANAWSNLAFILVALWMLRRSRVLRAAALRWFAPTVATIGAFSFVYHASNVHLTQLLDFLGMYLFCGLLLALNAVRLGWLRARSVGPALWIGALGLTAISAALVRLGAPIQAIVLFLIFGIIATELLCRRRAARSPRARAFVVGLVLLAAALVCSVLDATRVWCDPNDHVFQGHAMWHVLSAAALLASFVHYRQFDGELAGSLRAPRDGVGAR